MSIVVWKVKAGTNVYWPLWRQLRVACRVTPALARSPSTARMGLLLGAAVLSHWLLDLVVHARDLPLYDNTMKMGFVLGAGVALYLRGSRPLAAPG